MDRDFDGKLSFAEFMGEETPLEKVKPRLLLKLCNYMYVILLKDLEKVDWNYFFLTFG